MLKFWQRYNQKLHDLHYDYKSKNKKSVFGKYRINKGLFMEFKKICLERDITMTDIIIKAILTFIQEYNENNNIK